MHDFSWIKFYPEFADKLLKCKDDRKTLMNKIHEIHKAMGFSDMIDKFKDGSSRLKQDICPFTAMGEFNRNLTKENRISVESQLAEFLDVKMTPPENWPGIPIFDNRGRWLYSYDIKRKPDHIDKLWDIFKAALEYADNNKSNRSKFIELFDTVSEYGTSMGMLTIGLFWIRPCEFLPLDSSTKKYLKEKLGVEDLEPANGEEYLKLTEKIRNKLETTNDPCPFPTLSATAYYPDDDPYTGSKSNNVVEFEFTKKDFDSQTGKKDDAKYLNKRFKQLQKILQTHLSADFKKSKVYTAKPSGRPKKGIVKWKDYMWLGIVTDDALYNKTRESIQFQVSLKYNLLCHIWASWVAKDRISFMKEQYTQNPEKFLKILKDLPKHYAIEVHAQNSTHKHLISNINQEKLDKLFDYLNGKNVEFHLGISWNEKTVLEMKNNVIQEIATTFDKLLPAYKFLNGKDKITDLQLPQQFKECNQILNKKQIIFFGPPGTGKTYTADKLASSLSDNVRHVTFHPSYSYEEFVEGIKPDKNGNFSIKDGIFKKICKDAVENTSETYVLVIDEINRGRTEKIFGELITLIENDKRGKRFTHLAYSQEEFTVPENLLIIGTMNTADRSLTYLDAALRRRFGFCELLPNYSLVETNIEGILVHKLLEELNSRIIKHEGREKQIGHSYFMSNEKPIKTIDELYNIFYQEIIPLLQDYFYEDYDKLHLILGDKFVDKESMKIKHLPHPEFIQTIKEIYENTNQ